MKKQVLRTVTGFGLFSILALVAAAPAARAQSPVNIKVEVPFDFHVGERLMPAGRYTIRRAAADTNRTLVVAGEGEGERAAVATAPVAGREARRTALVFHRYGGEHFLRAAWTAGETEGREFAESKRERAARRQRRQLVRRGGESGPEIVPEIVEVTARR